ncbi:hypothetical protein CGL51_12685 [Pyrobaculum aerophilum]|uniref:PaRep2b domain-containing protein n=1 Tax=Pyrobaculum aerophilum TaxID=13773 RepID=A0A371QUT8_9CREN|nr:hypothetical protein CGL51_12685 [Pyrobaculum aerophilum]RFA96935.1 hypothetical protein CGL52_10225 [Pyrobaculum aerophilum]
MAKEVANKLDRIAYRLEDVGHSGIAERLRVATENVIRLAEATRDDLPKIDATRGERAVAALLSLVTGGLFGVTVERALAERGEWTIGALGVVSAVRSTPYSFYDVFKSTSGGEEPSETEKLAFRIATLLADPTMRAKLTGRQGVEVRVEEKEDNSKKLIYATFVDKDGRELLKVPWKAGKRLIPLWVEGEAVRPIEEVGKLAAAASSSSKPLEELGEEKWEKVVKATGETRKTVRKKAGAIAIGALPTDAVLYPGYEYVDSSSSYLSQAFTYWALAEGGIKLDRVYPSEEGLKPVWRVEGKYTETVEEVLSRGRAALEELSKSGIDLRTALADVKMSNDLKTALETAAGEFWSRVKELFSLWENAEKSGDVNTLNSLGKHLRVLLPLAYAVEAYRGGELSKEGATVEAHKWSKLSNEEAALAVIFAVLYDGTVLRDGILLAVGGPEQEENPIMTRDLFTAFWLWVLRELGFKPSSVRRGGGPHIIVFRGDELKNLLEALTPALPALHELRDALAEFADAFKVVTREVIKKKFGVEWAYDMKNEMFFKKLEEVVTMAEDYIYKNLVVERGPLDTSGQLPKTIIRFKLGGEEIASINVYWSEALIAQFTGSREKAEHLASIIRALGGEVEVKRIGKEWGIRLTTDGIIAIRHDGWLKGVRSFVDELHDDKRHGKKLISDERYEKLIKDIEAGPNTVKFAGVEFSVYYVNKRITVEYHPTNEASKNAAVDALKARGLKEGVHFTVTTGGTGSYEIRITKEAYAKAVEATAQSGLKKGEHYVVYNRWRIIRVKEEYKDTAVNVLKGAGLEEGKDFTIRSGKQYEIYITSEGLREIQRMALKGDVDAERFIRELEDVLGRRYGDNAVKKLMEVLTPAREEGTAELPLPVRDDKGNIIARVVDLRYEFVENGNPVSHCAGKDCRLRVVVEYELPSGERRQLKTEWYWAEKREKKGQDTATYYYQIAVVTAKDDVEAAVLKSLTGRAKRGKVYLLASQLDALRRFKPLKDAVDQWRGGRPASQQSPRQRRFSNP